MVYVLTAASLALAALPPSSPKPRDFSTSSARHRLADSFTGRRRRTASPERRTFAMSQAVGTGRGWPTFECAELTRKRAGFGEDGVQDACRRQASIQT